MNSRSLLPETAKPDPTGGAKTGCSGVRGWLLYLCIVLTIIVPVYFVTLIGDNMRLVERVLSIRNLDDSLFGRFQTVIQFQNTCIFLLTIMAVLSGISLFAKKRYGVFIAKVFLLSWPAFFLANIALVFLMDTYDAFPGGISPLLTKPVVNGVINAYAGLLYLRRSERVKATYGL